MYGADGLPLMLDQSWFSIRMRNTVWMGQAPEQVPGRVVVVVEVVEGHVNGPQVNPQLMSPTSQCAILRASSMLQAPSPLTSHASGWVSWLHWRSPTSNSATTSASPMSTTPSPFTSPQGLRRPWRRGPVGPRQQALALSGARMRGKLTAGCGAAY